MKLILTSGIPAAGKSTWLKLLLEDNPEMELICPDDIREQLTGDAADQSKNAEVWQMAYELLHVAFMGEKDVVFDSTMVDKKSRKAPLKIAKKYGAEKIAIAFPVTLETALERNAGRDRKVPDFIIEKFFKRFTLPSKSEGFSQVIIVDEITPKFTKASE